MTRLCGSALQVFPPVKGPNLAYLSQIVETAGIEPASATARRWLLRA
jgi:hypothetical protein